MNTVVNVVHTLLGDVVKVLVNTSVLEVNLTKTSVKLNRLVTSNNLRLVHFVVAESPFNVVQFTIGVIRVTFNSRHVTLKHPMRQDVQFVVGVPLLVGHAFGNNLLNQDTGPTLRLGDALSQRLNHLLHNRSLLVTSKAGHSSQVFVRHVAGRQELPSNVVNLNRQRVGIETLLGQVLTNTAKPLTSFVLEDFSLVVTKLVH